MIGDFITRLRQRQVVKTLLLYAAIGWGFYEIASEILTRFGFDDSIITLLLVFLLLGLPAALFLAWFFDLDRRGVHEESRMRRGDWAIVIASLLLPVVGVFVAKPWVEGTTATAGIGSEAVAVLPFANLTGDPSLEYLADGVAEEIIAALTGLHALDVSAMTQSFRFRGVDTDVHEVGRELGVAWVVRGSVRSSGNLLRFSASLIDARSGKSVWSESTDISKLAIFQGQDELSGAVTQALAAASGVELPAAIVVNVPDPEAYDLYLRGRHIWHRRGTVDIGPGVNMLAEATRIDPDFAKAWAALASAYLTWPSYSREGYATWDAAEDVAHKAIELDPLLPEPYAVLATFSQRRKDWISAHNFYVESLRLDEKNATANYWYGEHLASTGRYADSVRHIRRAIALDPTYVAPKSDLAYGYLTMGAFELGAAGFKAAWDDGFHSIPAWLGNFIALIVRGKFDDARQWATESQLPDDGKELLLRFIDVQAGGEDTTLTEEIFDAPSSAVDYRFKIWLLGRLGDYDTAMDYIEFRLDNNYALDTRPLWGIGIRLYEHEQFPALMERLNLLEYWNATDWGDVCRPADTAIVCDGHGLNPAALNAILSETY